jgi:uncharacterized protein YecE (DUF72 family)
MSPVRSRSPAPFFHHFAFGMSFLDQQHDSGFPGNVIRVGCAGWNIPRQTADKFGSGESHLARYSQIFNCCEINSSFYRPHKKETWERWARSVPDGFQFSVKVPKAITHEAKLNCSTEVLCAFLGQVEFLGKKLGPVLLQLPPSLAFELPRVTNFLALLREKFSGDVVCEPRHGSWFCEPADELLREYQIARVAADPPCVPVADHPGGSSSLAYFRLHGSPRRYYSTYEDDFLTKLAAKLGNLTSPRRAWCIFDNTASGHAVENALELKAKLKHSG